jgi:hypothetical protein
MNPETMAGKSNFLKGCKTFKKETLKIHSEREPKA